MNFVCIIEVITIQSRDKPIARDFNVDKMRRKWLFQDCFNVFQPVKGTLILTKLIAFPKWIFAPDLTVSKVCIFSPQDVNLIFNYVLPVYRYSRIYHKTRGYRLKNTAKWANS